MVRVDEVGRRNALEQLQLDLERVLARREAGAVRDAEDVRVDRHRGLAESDVEHDVGGLAADAGQCFERHAVAGHPAAVPRDQQAAGFEQVLRLGAVEADRADVRGEAVLAEREHLGRRVGDGEQPPRRLVDADIGRLRREQHRSEQLEHVGVFEFGLGLRVGGLQRREEALDVLRCHRGCVRPPGRHERARARR